MCLFFYFYSFIPTNVFLAFTRKTITLACIETDQREAAVVEIFVSTSSNGFCDF